MKGPYERRRWPAAVAVRPVMSTEACILAARIGSHFGAYWLPLVWTCLMLLRNSVSLPGFLLKYHPPAARMATRIVGYERGTGPSLGKRAV